MWEAGEQNTGRFAAGELPRTLEKAVNVQASGRVKVMQPGANRYIYFVGKKIRAITSEFEQERLGSWLVSQGFISQDSMDLALANKESQERLGSLLVRHGLITDMKLFEELHNLSISIAGRMLFEEGHYEIDADAVLPDDACTLDLSPTALFLNASRDTPDVGQFEMLVGGGRRFRARVQGAVSYGDVTYLPQEDLVLRALYRDLTFDKLRMQVDFEPKDLARCVVSLIVGGLVEATGMVVEKKPAKSAADGAATAPKLPPRSNQSLGEAVRSRSFTDIKYASTSEPLKPAIRTSPGAPQETPVSAETTPSGNSVVGAAPSFSPYSSDFQSSAPAETGDDGGFSFEPATPPQAIGSDTSRFGAAEQPGGFGGFHFENESTVPVDEQNYGESTEAEFSQREADLSWAPAPQTQAPVRSAFAADAGASPLPDSAAKAQMEDGLPSSNQPHSGQSGDDYDRAEAARREAFELLAVGGDLRRVVKLLSQSVEIIPDPVALVKLAQLEQANPNWRQRALDHLKKAVEVSPRSTEAWLELANYWGVRGQKEKQARCLQKILIYEPNNRVVRDTLNHLTDGL